MAAQKIYANHFLLRRNWHLKYRLSETTIVGMDLIEIVVVLVAGVAAGTANVVAGAGSLLTFPILVAVGLPPLAANVTNDIGVVAGNLSGVVGVRDGLRRQRELLWTLVPRAVLGSLVGAALLLVFPSGAFGWVAPPLLLASSALTLAQPALARRVAHNGSYRRGALHRTIEATSVYGGYFGTGIGLVFMAALGIFVDDAPARLNAVKTVLQLVSNGVAGVVFALVAPVHWPVAAALAAGSLAGGRAGAWATQRISPGALRATIAVIGLGASLLLLVQQLA
jgi:uncharacterized membrane protein YfcA